MFHLVEEDRETHAREASAQHGLAQLVVVALQLVYEWLELVLQIVFASGTSQLLQWSLDAFRLTVVRSAGDTANVAFVLFAFDFQGCQCPKDDLP